MSGFNFAETEAGKARYAGDVAEAFKDWEIFWAAGENDYQGSCELLARQGDRFLFYAWSYGSCSGCDEWENRGLGGEEIQAEVRRAAMILPDKNHLHTWLAGLEAENKPPRADYRREIHDRIDAIRAALGMPPREVQP